MEQGHISTSQPDNTHLQADVLNHLAPNHHLCKCTKTDKLKINSNLSGRLCYFIKLAKATGLVLG